MKYIMLLTVLFLSSCASVSTKPAPGNQTHKFKVSGTQGRVSGPYNGIFYPIPNRNYLPSLLSLIDSAKDSIYILMYQARYYPDYKGDVGGEILNHLTSALRRGVRVCAMFDASDWNKSVGRHNYEFGEVLRKHGAEVMFDPRDVTSHDKLIIVDGKYVVVGSTNWSFYALESNNEASCIIKSPGLAAYFTEYFNRIRRLSIKKLPSFYFPKRRYKRKKVVKKKKEGTKPPSMSFPPGPEEGYSGTVYPISNRDYVLGIHKAIKDAKKEILVLMLSARYYNGQYEYDANTLIMRDLGNAAKRGVHTEVILDASNFNRVNTVQNKPFADSLRKMGVMAYYDPLNVTTHAKMLVIDGQEVIIGSTNWSYHALELNDEATVLIKSKGLAKYFKAYFNKIKDMSGTKMPGWYRGD